MSLMTEPAGAATVPPDFLTLEEAAAVLRVGRSTAYREANVVRGVGWQDRDPGDSLREVVPGAALPARGTTRWPDHLAAHNHRSSHSHDHATASTA